LFLLIGFAVAADFCHPANASGADQDVQVIEVSAKKYEFVPSSIHVKQGAKVQLRFIALDKDHGFKVNAYPDGGDSKGAPGLVFNSHDECIKLIKESPTVVEFVAQTPGIYSFKCCNFCGLGHGGMKAQIIVEPSS
jgi:cytochrome c oxidase subunit 2